VNTRLLGIGWGPWREAYPSPSASSCALACAAPWPSMRSSTPGARTRNQSFPRAHISTVPWGVGMLTKGPAVLVSHASGSRLTGRDDGRGGVAVSQRLKVLSLLRHAGDTGVTNAVFLDWRIPRFSARILELREEGYEIRTDTEDHSRVRYTLVSEPAEGVLDAGVERTTDRGAAGVLLPPQLTASDSAGSSLSTGPDRLFDMEPERVGHYDREAA
jgi:hypothetical protein